MENMFVKNATLASGNAYTENGAASYATIGSELMDQFGKAGCYRDRDLSEVFDDQSKLWYEDKESAIRFPFYLRLITRKVLDASGKVTENVQRGCGSKDEAFKRLLWIERNHKDSFYNNIRFIPLVGSWKDLWTIMAMYHEYSNDGTFEKNGHKLDYTSFFNLMVAGLMVKNQRDLVKKYLPRIRSNSKCTTERAKSLNYLAKKFAKYLDVNPQEYRRIKSSGLAHDFQKKITCGDYDGIEFSKMPGKALLNLVSGKFLENHAQIDRYIDWLEAQGALKFNGYAYELGTKLKYDEEVSTVARITIDKQFENLIATAKGSNGGINGNVWCALDTSGSMTCPVSPKSNLSAFDVCVSLGIYFSELNDGSFHNSVIMFDSVSKVKQLRGGFSDKWKDIVKSETAWGSTNFQSVIDEIIRIRTEHPEIPLSDYPQTLLVVSDMQFDSCGDSSNIERSRKKLCEYFPEDWADNFTFIWWMCTGRPTDDVPMTELDKNSYMLSGFDGSVISFILGGEDKVNKAKEKKTFEEIIQEALSQEILTCIK